MTTMIVIAVSVALALLWLKTTQQDRHVATLYAHHQRLAARIEQYRREAPTHARTQELAQQITELKTRPQAGVLTGLRLPVVDSQEKAVEKQLHKEVCAGTLALYEAQDIIATDSCHARRPNAWTASGATGQMTRWLILDKLFRGPSCKELLMV